MSNAVTTPRMRSLTRSPHHDKSRSIRNPSPRVSPRQAAGLRRDAACRPRRVRTAQGSRYSRGGAARGRRQRRESSRYQRLLWPAYHQPADPRSAASVLRRPSDRHQGRRPAWRGRFLEPGLLARGADPGGARQPAQPRTRRTRRGQPARDVRHAWAGRRLPRGASRGAGRPAAPRLGSSHRSEQRHGQADRGGPPHGAHRLRAEPLQSRAARRRCTNRDARPRWHCLRAVLSDRAASNRCNRRPCPRLPCDSALRPCRWRWRGCCIGRRTSC